MKKIKNARSKDELNSRDKEYSMIVDAIRESTIEYDETGMGPKVTITHSFDDFYQVAEIHKTILNVAKSKGDLFVAKNSNMLGIKRRSVQGVSELSRNLLDAMKTDFRSIMRDYPLMQADPIYTIFEQICIKHDALFWALEVTRYGHHGADDKVKFLNEFVNDIRTAVNQDDFKKMLDNWTRGVNKNFASMVQWIDRHFEHCSRLLVLRVDLHFNKKQNGEDVSAREARESVDEFLKEMHKQSGKRQQLESVLGYILKREYGLRRGFHYHALFILNGHNVQRDKYYAEEIGLLWVKVLHGKGYFYNCNRKKGNYLSCGIGMVKRTDEKMRSGLKKALFYLAKRDMFIRLRCDDGERNLRKSAMPPPKINFQ